MRIFVYRRFYDARSILRLFLGRCISTARFSFCAPGIIYWYRALDGCPLSNNTSLRDIREARESRFFSSTDGRARITILEKSLLSVRVLFVYSYAYSRGSGRSVICNNVSTFTAKTEWDRFEITKAPLIVTWYVYTRAAIANLLPEVREHLPKSRNSPLGWRAELKRASILSGLSGR